MIHVSLRNASTDFSFFFIKKKLSNILTFIHKGFQKVRGESRFCNFKLVYIYVKVRTAQRKICPNFVTEILDMI